MVQPDTLKFGRLIKSMIVKLSPIMSTDSVRFSKDSLFLSFKDKSIKYWKIKNSKNFYKQSKLIKAYLHLIKNRLIKFLITHLVD